MPELPEVEGAARKLGAWVEGRTLDALEILDPAVLKAGAAGDVAGAPALGARRRAKYIALELGERAVVIHLRMTGKLVLGEAPGRARLRLGDRVVTFQDVRRFGEIWVVEDLEGFFAGRKLGEEPWPARRGGPWWAGRLAGLKGPIKPALLKQDRVAGLGNIAASEILWRAGVRPQAPVPSLTAARWAALAAASPAHLELALADALREDFVYLTESRAQASNPFRVYGRAGQPCPRCATPIVRLVQSGRSTFWCPGCQS